MVPQLIHASASIDRLEELEQLDVETASEKSNKLQGQVGIRMDDVSFRYAKGDHYILEHFSHDFRPGSRTALVGQTGAGKTTIFRLLLALTSPESGSINLYTPQQPAPNTHHPVTPDTRSNFVFVPQGNTLMSGTIRYNLKLAKPDATEEELRHVLHMAVADFVLDLPQGIDTECGEREQASVRDRHSASPLPAACSARATSCCSTK